MRGADRRREEPQSFKPIGGVFAAVVAGLAVPAQAEPVKPVVAPPPAPAPETARVHYIDPTNDPALAQDDSLILGPSEPVELFSAPAEPRQKDLFDL